jgi:hypothetical protein
MTDMTYFESLSFVYRLVFARFDPPVWVWSIGALLLTLLVLHWGWGRLWNRHWGLFTSPGMGITSLLLALLVGASTQIYVAADRSEQWLDLQRATLPKQLADSGSLNRRIFQEARGRLGQPPGPVENEMTLRDAGELEVATESAAAAVRCPLRPSGPLGPGAPCQLRDPVSLAQEIVSRMPASAYPLVVSPDNPWFRAAVSAQVQAALDHAAPLLREGTRELKGTALMVLVGALTLIVIVVPMAAVSNIQVHPKV